MMINNIDIAMPTASTAPLPDVRSRPGNRVAAAVEKAARLPTLFGEFRAVGLPESAHMALVMGRVKGRRDVLVRVHSECLTGDVFGSRRCDCRKQLHDSLRMIRRSGSGIVVYLRQEGRGVGLYNKLQAYCLQDRGLDTVEANEALGLAVDARTYEAAALLLQSLAVRSVRIMTNNPAKLDALSRLGVVVTGRISLHTKPTRENAHYMATKLAKMGHLAVADQVNDDRSASMTR